MIAELLLLQAAEVERLSIKRKIPAAGGKIRQKNRSSENTFPNRKTESDTADRN